MDTQKTALYEFNKNLGAKFVPFAGYEMPVQYSTGIVEEHKLTRNKAGLFDVSHMGQLSIEGNHNLELALENIIPIDLKSIKLNQSKYSFLTNEKGGIYDDLIVTKVAKGFNIILNAACKKNDFVIIQKTLEDKFKLNLEFVSGGNSANYDWFMSTKDVGRINNLRLGESIFFGCETLERKTINGLFTDAFTLIAEVIESKRKPSLPYGDVCQNAFGNIPKFPDLGLMKRAILGVGLQDVLVSGLTPLLDIDILGASSDHIIIDAKQLEIKVGDTVEFNLNYGALLSSMTSPYIIKIYKKL